MHGNHHFHHLLHGVTRKCAAQEARRVGRAARADSEENHIYLDGRYFLWGSMRALCVDSWQMGFSMISHLTG